MSDEQFMAFLDAIKADAGLQAAMNAAANAEAEAVVAIAKDAGFDITVEDLEQHNTAIREIDERELDGVVGGTAPAVWAQQQEGGTWLQVNATSGD